MSRYIDAEGLIDRLYEEEFTIVCPLDEVSGVINNEPTADVRPVRHGSWIDGCEKCPICGESKFKDLAADIWSDWKPLYCPNCGAKMEEKK